MEGSALLTDWQSRYPKLGQLYTYELTRSLTNDQGNANVGCKQKSIYTHLMCKGP